MMELNVVSDDNDGSYEETFWCQVSGRDMNDEKCLDMDALPIEDEEECVAR